MEQIYIIGIDLAKHGFQLQGVRENKEGKTPWDCTKANATLRGAKPYWRHNDALFR